MLPLLRKVALAVLLHAIALPAYGNETSVTAVWRPQRATFVYTGTATRYTCSALTKKITRALQTLGAHPDSIAIDRGACSDHSTARLLVTFASPVVASAENVRAITNYEAREQLAAKLNGRHLSSFMDLPRFDAEWREVSFGRSRQLRLDPAECELVHDIRRQLLPRLSVRVLTNRVACTPGYPGIAPPRLTVSALFAIERIPEP